VENFCAGSDRCVSRQDMLGGIARSLEDCSGIITMRIGYAPERELSERGIRVFITYDYAENAVREAAKKLGQN
jgi:predicted Fe-Mo cluster-binding NifX family protein